MKFQHFNKFYLFASGFCCGIALFYLHFKNEITEKIKHSRENAVNNAENILENAVNSGDIKEECVSSPILKYIQRLTGCRFLNENGEDEDSKTLELIATGEIIRQIIDTEHNVPTSFKDLELFKRLLGEESDFCDDITNEINNQVVTDEHQAITYLPSCSAIVRNTASKELCHSPSFVSSSEFQTKSHSKGIKTSKGSKNNTSTSLSGKDFQKFADEHLRMPSIMFITPYPLHMVYRKLKVKGHTDFGYCHPVVLPYKSSPRFNIQNGRLSIMVHEKYGSEMDWPLIYNSDSLPDPSLPDEFHKLFSKGLLKMLTNTCWFEHYYTRPNFNHQSDYYVEDIPEYQLFIVPLFYCLNSKISEQLNEYYSIVSKQS